MSSIGTKLKCPDYGGVLISEGVLLCTGFNGVELGPEDVSLLEKCPLLGMYLSVYLSSKQSHYMFAVALHATLQAFYFSPEKN